MPFELDAVEVEDDVLAEPPPDEVVCVDGLDDWVDELEELEPQAARPRAANASSAAASRRVDLVLVAFIILLSVGPGKSQAKT
jgi:hypothetical protein